MVATVVGLGLALAGPPLIAIVSQHEVGDSLVLRVCTPT